jgi:hypothetical protein
LAPIFKDCLGISRTLDPFGHGETPFDTAGLNGPGRFNLASGAIGRLPAACGSAYAKQALRGQLITQYPPAWPAGSGAGVRAMMVKEA